MIPGFHTSVQQNRARKPPNGLSHMLVTRGRIISPFYGSGMDAHKSDRIFGKDIEDGFEKTVILETDSHLNGEQEVRFLGQNLYNLPNFLRISKKPPSNVFSINPRSRAPQVQIQPGNRIGIHFPGDPSQVIKVFTDQLGEYRSSVRLIDYRGQNFRTDARMSVNADKLGKVEIRTPPPSDHLHERQARHVLHRGKGRWPVSLHCGIRQFARGR